MRQRTVNLGVAMMVAPRRAIPALGLEIVGIRADRGDRITGPGRTLLVKSADQPVPFVPVEERLEEGRLGQAGPNGVIVGPSALGLGALALPQQAEPWAQVVAGLGLESLQEIGAPGRQRGQLILKRADDDVAEEGPGPPREGAVNRIDQRGACNRVDIVEAAPNGEDQAQPAQTWAVIGGPQVIQLNGRGHAGVEVRHGRPERLAAGRAGEGQRAVAFDRDRVEPLSNERRRIANQATLQIGPREADLVVEPQPHAELARVGADTEEDLPPRLRQKGRVIGVAAVERAGRGQVEDDQVVDAAGDELLELPAQARGIEALTAPPPDRDRREFAARLGEPAREVGQGVRRARGPIGAEHGADGV